MTGRNVWIAEDAVNETFTSLGQLTYTTNTGRHIVNYPSADEARAKALEMIAHHERRLARAFTTLHAIDLHEDRRKQREARRKLEREQARRRCELAECAHITCHCGPQT